MLYNFLQQGVARLLNNRQQSSKPGRILNWAEEMIIGEKSYFFK